MNRGTPPVILVSTIGLWFISLVIGCSNHDRSEKKGPNKKLVNSGKHFIGNDHPELEKPQSSSVLENPPPHSAFVGDLLFKSRQQQLYKIKFVAIPDTKRFQLTRIPSVKWPNRQTFLLKIGETSTDGQLKIEKFTEKQARSPAGVFVDASELNVTFLETGRKVILVRNVVEQIPIYFGEFRSKNSSGTSFYIKEGDSFDIPGSSEKWILKEVKKESCIISRKTEEGKEITKELKKSD